MTDLANKLICLGKRQKLTTERHNIIMALGEVELLNFNNYSVYKNSLHSAQYNGLLTWVKQNLYTDQYDQLIRNGESAKGFLEFAKLTLNHLLNIMVY